ncbi:CBS domain-containing protein [Actinoallomurus rhizosphaericola]|uniref:CBS domain-containing protein n=1 Tax=Actinoallomurus rhizosphaericola TaxID=2952536 RepID=UPI00209279D9|nr:CBS domain-containing protein [Actinoallomurus rhizosphaericola]MCO5996283.1 CBS domain-containing protein [Actinoallomurus rhizosphaericola]
MFRDPAPEDLLALKDRTVLLRDLLDLFGVRVRNFDTVPRIQQALAEAGLSTVPSFATCPATTEVHIVAAEAMPSVEDGDGEQDEPSSAVPQQSFKIGDLPSAQAGLTSVSPNTTLAQAIHMMLTRNFSQLPVIDGLSHLHGVITWSSIATRYATGKQPTLTEAMITDSLPIAEVHQELFAHLPAVSEYGYLLVRGNNGKFTGIVTASDITARFEVTAKPFFIVGEIEQRLRKCLGEALSADAICDVQPSNKKTGNIADLMFSGYQRLLKKDENWNALGWTGIDRPAFLHDLDRVRMIRNEIAHFDPGPLTDQKLTSLHRFVGLLKQLT